MSDGLMLYFDENGVAKEYTDEYDITIHCESEEERNKYFDLLNRNMVVDLDKIRADISALVSDDPEDDYQYGYNDALMKVAHIIDKYKIQEVEL